MILLKNVVERILNLNFKNKIGVLIYLITILYIKNSDFFDEQQTIAFKISLFIGILLYASYYDIVHRTIPNVIHVCILIISLLNTNLNIYNSSILGVAIAIPFLIVACCSNGNIGGGDIKLIGACGIILGMKRVFIASLIGLILAIVINLAYNTIKKKSINESFPLVPYLSVGCFISIFIN